MLQLFTRRSIHRLRIPRLHVVWQSRWQGFLSSLGAVLGGPKAPKEFRGEPYFRDSWVRPHWPKRAVFVSALLHIALVYFPFPRWSWLRPTHEPLLFTSDTELTYYGPIRDLPLVNPSGPPLRPRPRGKPEKPLPRRGADAYHPRQTIISAPKMPTHPRQTLIRPDAPPEPPKILTPVPNTVKWADSTHPARPRLQISREVLARLRPKKPVMRFTGDVPVPDLPNSETQPGALNIASSDFSSAKPRMPITPTVVPRTGPHQAGTDAGPAPDVRVAAGSGASSDFSPAKPRMPVTPAVVPRTGPHQAGTDAGPAPDVRIAAGSGDAGVQRLVAISPTPDDGPSNLPLPAGNLSARFSISPEGKQPGTPGGSPSGTPAARGSAGGAPASSGGTSSSGGSSSSPALPDISISGGNPNASSSGLGGAASPPSPAPAPKIESSPPPPDPDPEPALPSIGRLRPGSAPESIFGPRRIYTLHVNMPNLASVTGSWVLSFVEMRHLDDGPAPSTELTGPVPLRKVDPKYPNSMIDARVEGEVVLYAVIRRDGTVDSIQLVRGIEPELDQNAMDALARWKFRPAERRGTPVELEAIVHIPFRLVAR